jgi:chromosome segregation protein
VHIVELRIAGFKSFVDPVKLTIDGGLTGVVGPNGCGKSNLLEAVRWGMGATSAKAMRADDMDDVIFAGTNDRPAREFAEVVLVIDGARTPEAAEERLEISRKIKRQAGSTYRINGREARAKDVQLLFADASTGANSPALVRQGQISELIAARPENRRRILEEAAGVAGLHARRHDADLKLSQATANLDRLREVSAEIEGQRATLKRQARAAERYRGLSAEIRKLEATAAARRWLDQQDLNAALDADARAAERAMAHAETRASAATRALDAARAALEPLREEDMIATAVLRRLEGERVGLERDVAEAKAAYDRAAERLASLTSEQEREARLADDAAQALRRLKAEQDELGAAGHPDARAAAYDRAEQARAARQAAEAALDAARTSQADARARHEAAVRSATLARAASADAAARHAAALRDGQTALDLDPIIARLAKARAEATALHAAAETAQAAVEATERAAASADETWRRAQTEAAREDAKRAELAAEARALDNLAVGAGGETALLASIDVDPGYERAVAAALGDDIEAALDAAALHFWRGATAPTLTWPADVEPLSDHMRAPVELAARLSACAIAPASRGAALQPQLSPGARLVSVEGDLWRWDGLTRLAGAPSAAAVRLEQKNRLTALKRQLKAAEAATERARSIADKARTARDGANAAREAARKAAPAALSQAVRADAAVAATKADLDRAEAHRDAAQRRVTALQSEATAARDALASAEALLAKTPAPDPAPIAAASARTDELRVLAAEAEASVRALDTAEAQRTARLAAIAREIAAWNAREAGARARLQEIDTTQAAAQAALSAARDRPASADAALKTARERTEAAEQRGRRARDDLSSAERLAREAETTARGADSEAAAARERIAAALLRTEEAAALTARLRLQVAEALQCGSNDLDAAAAGLLRESGAAAPIADIDKRVAKLKGERDAGGPVNLRALEELEAVEARLEDIARERADVESAIAKLRQAIGKLNGEARRRLLAAHEVVNARFADLFATLFEGGQAELRLTDAEDPLACGLDIFAQPPGKRLANLSLMSGGEQALTACALIFAVFLANPAPICVLDEVDAPLDDANVERFCRLLEAMKARTETRFMVITHNPVTMARMDRLFGVTMPERGASQIVTVDLQRAAQLVAAE